MTDTARDLIEQSKREERLAAFDLATHRRPFATATELAAYLDCDPRTIVRMIHSGALEGVKVGRVWKVSTAAARAAFHVQQKHAS